jgi:hypothetical protein
VNHIVVGVVAVLLVLLFLYLLDPVDWSKATHSWKLLQEAVNAALLVPIFLILVYVVGAVMPSSSSLDLFGEATGRFSRTFRRLGIIREASTQNELIQRLFHEKAAKQFQQQSQKELFMLALSSVLMAGPSMEQMDIERHFVLMHFNAKLCALFVLAAALSMLGCVWSGLAVFGLLPMIGSGPKGFALLTFLFYSASRASGTKAQNNNRHWKTLVMRSFVVIGSVPPMTA